MVLFIAEKNIHGTTLRFSLNHPQTWCIFHGVASSELATLFPGRDNVNLIAFFGSLLNWLSMKM